MANINDYYRKNHLYSSHRLFLPEFRQKAVNTCRSCRFYITIIGRETRKKGCAALIPKYFAMEKKVPAKIDIMVFLREIGKAGLAEATNCCGDHLNACSRFSAARQ